MRPDTEQICTWHISLSLSTLPLVPTSGPRPNIYPRAGVKCSPLIGAHGEALSSLPFLIPSFSVCGPYLHLSKAILQGLSHPFQPHPLNVTSRNTLHLHTSLGKAAT